MNKQISSFGKHTSSPFLPISENTQTREPRKTHHLLHRCSTREDIPICGLPLSTSGRDDSVVYKGHYHKIQAVGALPSNTLLVTLDVSSFYTNIPHEEGIAACTEALAARHNEDPPTHDLTILISNILKKNNFVFGDQHYIQIHGTAMGTRMAPSYTNLFMAKLETSLLSRPTTLKPLVWWRYIDDIFALWMHGEETLKEFIDDLNIAHFTIKFTSEWSYTQIPFLDTLVSVKDGALSTDLHIKKTDTQLPPLALLRQQSLIVRHYISDASAPPI